MILSELEAAANALNVAALKHEYIAPLRDKYPQLDIDSAYAIQRINTEGGQLEGACSAAGSFNSVPYAADYVFLRK